MTLGGRQGRLPRLRVRNGDGKVPLASFQWAAATDALEAHTLKAIAAGVSTRQYARTLDPVLAAVSERATSRSVVSRRFVALSTERLGALVNRPLASWTCVWDARLGSAVVRGPRGRFLGSAKLQEGECLSWTNRSLDGPRHQLVSGQEGQSFSRKLACHR